MKVLLWRRPWLAGRCSSKYVNPENPAETWAGRGLKPCWLAAKLKSGKKLEDFSIEAAGKKPRAGGCRKAVKQ
jgi:DNA-binding protein H-NS